MLLVCCLYVSCMFLECDIHVFSFTQGLSSSSIKDSCIVHKECIDCKGISFCMCQYVFPILLLTYSQPRVFRKHRRVCLDGLQFGQRACVMSLPFTDNLSSISFLVLNIFRRCISLSFQCNGLNLPCYLICV